jgi:hypothetical protein
VPNEAGHARSDWQRQKRLQLFANVAFAFFAVRESDVALTEGEDVFGCLRKA